MPRWLPIARDFAATRKRFTIPQRIGEMLSGIIPTYQVERNWPGDQLDLWGINGISDFQIPDEGAMAPLFIAASLHNISDSFPRELQKELLIWRVIAAVTVNGVQIPQNGKLHLFSPGLGYNPEAIPATGPLPNTGIFLPWLQPQRPTEVLHFPTAGHLDVGYNTALQLTSIGGDFHIGIGPSLSFMTNTPLTAGGTESDFSLGGVDAPPYRIQPGRKLTVQSTNSFAFDTFFRLEASIWYSERDYAVGQ